MDEKKRNFCKICDVVGNVSLLVYILLTIAGSSDYLLAIKLIFAGIAAIAFSIKLNLEILSEESCGNTVFLIVICLLDIVRTAIRLG